MKLFILKNHAPAVLMSLFVLLGPAFGAVRAQDTCPCCGLDVLKDTPSTDNRVVTEISGKKHAYRCVYCAIVDAPNLKGDLEILAPSEKKGELIHIKRKNGEWSISPKTSVFTYAEGSHEHCQVLYRAISSKEVSDKYIQSDTKHLHAAKILTLFEILVKVKESARAR